jgi:hyperosmotically inducible periplasmic protein
VRAAAGQPGPIKNQNEEKTTMAKRMRAGMILGATLLVTQLGFAENHKTEAGPSRVEREVRRELVTLPFYSLFDNFTFRVDGETVTLMGKVSRPTLRRDAENVVRKIEGVEKVLNEIEILPLSPNDDRLRVALYHSIYGHSGLETLSIRAVPPIHIIVENGNVTLEGVAANEMQKNIAGLQANGVSGVFSVTNNLRVESNN